MIDGGPNALAYGLLAAGAAMALAWAVVRRFASPRLRSQLRPGFAGLTAGLFLGIAYVLTSPQVALFLAVPIAIIAYFNIVGRQKRKR